MNTDFSLPVGIFLSICSTSIWIMRKRKMYTNILKNCEQLCKKLNKRLWLVLSDRDGTKFNHKTVHKYLLKRGLIVKEMNNNNNNLLSLEAIEMLSIYVRGHVANNFLVVSNFSMIIFL